MTQESTKLYQQPKIIWNPKCRAPKLQISSNRMMWGKTELQTVRRTARTSASVAPSVASFRASRASSSASSTSTLRTLRTRKNQNDSSTFESKYPKYPKDTRNIQKHPETLEFRYVQICSDDSHQILPLNRSSQDTESPRSLSESPSISTEPLLQLQGSH